jgi:hypothetical protein
MVAPTVPGTGLHRRAPHQPPPHPQDDAQAALWAPGPLRARQPQERDDQPGPAVAPGALARSGASGSYVDLPADAVPVGDGAEGVAPELPFQLGPNGAALGETVEQCPQPRVVGSDEG